MIDEILSISEMAKQIRISDMEIKDLLNKKEKYWLDTQPKPPTYNEINVKATIKEDKFFIYVWRCEDEVLEQKLDDLQATRFKYLSKIRSQLKIAREYNDYLSSIIFYREIYRNPKTEKSLTWDEISKEIHLCKSSCRDIYSKYKKTGT